MNDIVTSLRRMGIDWAADEIERLRVEYARQAEAIDFQLHTNHEIRQLQEKLAASQAREEKLLDFIQNAPVSSGVCCCGEGMDHHSGPMSCGHSPCDQWDWSVQCMVEESKKHDRAALNERLAQERERIAKWFEKRAQEYASDYGYDDMGGLSFGSGIGGEIKMDYYNELLENASLIRNLGDEA